MSKISLNYSVIETNCIPAIDNLVGYLDAAIGSLQQTSVPRDFYKRETLINTISHLKSYSSSLSKTKDWLKDSNKNYDSMIDKLESQARKLPTNHVERRKQVIN